MKDPRTFRVSACCLIWSLTYGQVQGSFGSCSGLTAECSEEAKEKRPQAKAKKVYTNEDLVRLRNQKRINQAESVSPPASEKSGSKKSRDSASLAGYKDSFGHDRTYWQNKIKPLKSKLEGLESRIRDLQQRQNEMNAASGIKVSRRGQLRASGDTRHSISQQVAALEKRRTDVLKSIQEVEEEARKAQALPEWLR